MLYLGDPVGQLNCKKDLLWSQNTLLSHPNESLKHFIFLPPFLSYILPPGETQQWQAMWFWERRPANQSQCPGTAA